MSNCFFLSIKTPSILTLDNGLIIAVYHFKFFILIHKFPANSSFIDNKQEGNWENNWKFKRETIIWSVLLFPNKRYSKGGIFNNKSKQIKNMRNFYPLF